MLEYNKYKNTEKTIFFLKMKFKIVVSIENKLEA